MSGGAVGYVSQIYNGSAVDGPGLRCVIFLAGCNLRCPFCHNPETFEMHSGGQMTARQAADRVLKYKAYIKKGGVTFSGGEPLMQPEFVLAVMRILHDEGIHCAVQTNATIIGSPVTRQADLIIADIKNFDGEIHAGTQEFLHECRQFEKTVHATNVIVTGKNDDSLALKRLKELITKYDNITGLTFLPFKKYCIPKYEKLNMVFPYKDRAETDTYDIERVRRLYDSL